MEKTICDRMLDFIDPIHQSVIDYVKALKNIEELNIKKAYIDGVIDGLSVHRFDNPPKHSSPSEYFEKNYTNDKN